MSTLDQFYMPDAISLYSGTLSVTGAGTGVDTTGYQSITAQLSGVFDGAILFEASNDNATWAPQVCFNVNELSSQDEITGAGIYTISIAAKYLRYNVIEIGTGSMVLSMLGRAGKGPSAVDALSQAMDAGNNTPLNVNILSGLKKDASGALVASDCAGPFEYAPLPAGGVIIDTIGYNNACVELQGGSNISIQARWSNVPTVPSTNSQGLTYGTSTTGGGISIAQALTLPASGISVMPCMGRYLILGNSTALSCRVVVYLRNLATGLPLANITTIAGTAISTGTGANTQTLPIAGGNITGTTLAVSNNPVHTGQLDSNGVLRRTIGDAAGRIAVVGTGLDPSGTSRTNGLLPPGSNTQNIASQLVTLADQFEGQSIAELLGMILLEMRIANQLRFDASVATVSALEQLQTGRTNKQAFDMDEPAQYRADPTIFTTQ